MTKAKHSGDIIGVGIYPGLWNTQELCNHLRPEQGVKAFKPLLYILSAEPVIAAERHEARYLACVRTYPVGCHDKYAGEIVV
jgi:hypothetical protein